MMLKKQWGAIESYHDWIRPKIVANALELLDKEIPRYKGKVSKVYISFATDPFMYGVQEVEDLTLEILSKLNQHDIGATLISKGVYPDMLADRSIYCEQNEYGATIVSLSDNFRKEFEPNTAPYSLRIEALRKLHDAGLKTWVCMEPYPTPNIMKQDLREILHEVAFVDTIVFGRWNYNSKVSGFIHRKQFYNSMANEVVRFCTKNSIDVYVKGKTIEDVGETAGV